MKTVILTFLIASLVASTSCSNNDDAPVAKPTFVLVHGSFAGLTAWQLVKPKLEQAGYSVVTFDLPTHGDDQTALSGATLDTYVSTTVKKINAITGKVVLVGHSMAGIVISQIAEQMPAKIEKLVYLSAFLPKNGQSLVDLANTDPESLLGPNLHPTADFSTASLDDTVLVQIFAVDAPEDIKKQVIAKKRPEPLQAYAAKVTLTDANFGKVPKYYIKTLKDQGVGPLLQQRMIDANGTVLKTYTISSSHSSYYAKPDELVAILKEIN